MRRHHGDGVEIGALDQRFVVLGQIEFVLSREGRRHRGVDIAAGHDLETRTFRETRHDLLAPPAEPDDADSDHCQFPFSFRKGRHAARYQTVRLAQATRSLELKRCCALQSAPLTPARRYRSTFCLVPARLSLSRSGAALLEGTRVGRAHSITRILAMEGPR